VVECKEIRELLSAYIDGEVTSEEKGQVERHLQSCPECRETYGQYVDIGTVLKSLPFWEPDSSLKEKVKEKIKPQKGFIKRVIWTEWLAAAVVVVLIFTLGVAVSAGLSGVSLFPVKSEEQVAVSKDFTGAVASGAGDEQGAPEVVEKRPAMYVPTKAGQLPGSRDMETSAAAGERKIIKTASGKLTVKTLEDFDRWLNLELKNVSGYIKYSREEKESRDVTLMIPADKLSSFVDALKKQGELKNYSENAEDVTKAYRDMEIRVKNLESEIKAVRSLLAKAQKIEEIMAVRAELNRLTEELEITKASLEDLKQNVSYSTLNLTVIKEKEAQIGEDSIFKNLGKKIKEQFIKAFNNFFTVLIKIFFLCIYLLPYLILILIILFLVLRFKKKKSV